jgi:hypothetical protein
MTRYWLPFSACAIAATAPLFMTGVLPMADLPEHMAQIAIWKHLGDACHQFRDTFRVSLATPYLLGTVVTAALSTLMSVSAAIKVTVWLSVMLLPLSTRALLLRGGGDPWLALLGFPLAYGYAFYWGFLNFSLAIPIGVFYLALLLDGRRRDVSLTLLALLMLSAHGLVFVFCAIVTVVVAGLRRHTRLLLPLVPALMLIAIFAIRLRSGERLARGGVTWMLSPLRVADFPSLLFGNAFEPLGLLLVAGMAVAIAVSRPGVTRDLARWSIVGVAGLLYLVAPQGAFGSAFLYPRFAVIAAVGALLLFEPRRRSMLSRTLLVLIVFAWMAVLSNRFRLFDAEVQEFERLVAGMPPNRRVAQFNVDPFSDHVPGPVFWHFGALYQVRKGGVAAWSFARHYPQVVRFREGAEPLIRSESTPVDGIDWPGVLQYDYLLVRGSDARRHAFRNAPLPIALRARSGSWWLYETPRARAAQRDCPPLNE